MRSEIGQNETDVNTMLSRTLSFKKEFESLTGYSDNKYKVPQGRTDSTANPG